MLDDGERAAGDDADPWAGLACAVTVPGGPARRHSPGVDSEGPLRAADGSTARRAAGVPRPDPGHGRCCFCALLNATRPPNPPEFSANCQLSDTPNNLDM